MKNLLNQGNGVMKNVLNQMKRILNQRIKTMKRTSGQMNVAAMKNTPKSKVSKTPLKKIAAVALSILIGGGNGVVIQTALQAIIQIGSSSNAYGEIVSCGANEVTSQNGVDMVQINPPNDNGISRNYYTVFDVNKKGLIINNNNGDGKCSSLVGKNINIEANPNLKGHGEASVILNEVVSGASSTIDGPIEILGNNKPDLIIANQNGIAVNGASFINAAQVALITGYSTRENVTGTGANPTISFMLNDKARMTLGGNWVNTQGGVDYASVINFIGRRVNINKGNWTRFHYTNINVLTGNKQVDYYRGNDDKNSEFRVTSDLNLSGTEMLDSVILGGENMRAGKIRIIATEQGVGVNVLGSGMSVDSVEFEVVKGDLNIAKYAHISAYKINAVVLDGDIKNNGVMSVMPSFINSASISLTANNINNEGKIATFLHRDGTIKLDARNNIVNKCAVADADRCVHIVHAPHGDYGVIEIGEDGELELKANNEIDNESGVIDASRGTATFKYKSIKRGDILESEQAKAQALARTQADLAQAQQANQILTQERNQALSQVQTRNQALSQVQTQAQQAAQSLAQAQQTIQSQDQALARFQLERSQIAIHQVSVEQEKATADARIRSLEQENARFQSQLTQENQDKEKTKRIRDRSRETRERENADLREENTRLQSQLAQADQDKAKTKRIRDRSRETKKRENDELQARLGRERQESAMVRKQAAREKAGLEAQLEGERQAREQVREQLTRERANAVGRAERERADFQAQLYRERQARREMERKMIDTQERIQGLDWFMNEVYVATDTMWSEKARKADEAKADWLTRVEVESPGHEAIEAYVASMLTDQAKNASDAVREVKKAVQ